MQTVADILLAARQILEKGWTRENAALDMNGRPVAPTSPLATRWDLGGALDRVADYSSIVDDVPARTALFQLRYSAAQYLRQAAGCSLSHYNNRRATKVSDVLALIDRTLAALKENLS